MGSNCTIVGLMGSVGMLIIPLPPVSTGELVTLLQLRYAISKEVPTSASLANSLLSHLKVATLDVLLLLIRSMTRLMTISDNGRSLLLEMSI
jgi:hypothetical protein